jgi:hypothetical protein
MKHFGPLDQRYCTSVGEADLPQLAKAHADSLAPVSMLRRSVELLHDGLSNPLEQVLLVTDVVV